MKKTKRLIPLLLAALMCFSLIVPVSATGETEIEYIVKMDSWTAVPTSAASNNGFQMLNAYLDANGGRSTVENGILYLMTEEVKTEVNSNNNPVFTNQKSDGKLDLQLNAIRKETSENVTLSMQIKPIGKIGNTSSFFAFTTVSPDVTTGDKLRWTENKLQILDGNTNPTSKVFPTDAFTTLEFQLFYENGQYTKADCYVDGVKLGSVPLAAGHTKMSRFRMLATYTEDTGFAVGSVALFKGHSSLYTERDYVSQSDFVRFADVPTNDNAKEATIGWRGLNGYAGTSSSVENGELKFINSNTDTTLAAFDLLPYEKNKTTLTGDMTLSTEIKLIGESWWESYTVDGFMNFKRHDSTGSGTTHKYFSILNGCIVMTTDTGKVLSGVLPKDSFSTVEWMFQYDETNNCYTDVECYVNGMKLGSHALDDKPANISFFRLFSTNTGGDGVSIDSFAVVKGCRSLYTPDTENPTVSVKGYQTTNQDTTDNTFDLRLVGLLHDEAYASYDKVGFEVTVTYGDVTKSVTKNITTVYTKITAGETQGYTEYTAENLGGEHIYVLNCVNIPVGQGIVTFTVTPYYQNDGGVVTAGVTKTFTVDPDEIPASDLPAVAN